MFTDPGNAISLYGGEEGLQNADDIFAGAMSDYLWRLPALRLAGAAQERGMPVYTYLMDWGPTGCWHGFDLPFIFGNFPPSDLVAEIGDDRPARLCEAMQQSWIAFVRSGDPGNTVVGRWQRFDAVARTMTIFSRILRLPRIP